MRILTWLVLILLETSVCLPGPAAAAPRPRLVVLLVVDQLRGDALDRLTDQFTGGLRRLLQTGAVYSSAMYEQWPTLTAVGHATIATGATPAGHGVVGNAWFDRNAGKVMSSVADPDARTVPSGSRGSSPRKLRAQTIGDQLRLATGGRSCVVTASIKDRSAILLAGKNPTGAYWIDPASLGYVTSTYYRSELPEWVSRFNAAGPIMRYKGATWTLALPETAYERSAPDDSPGEPTDRRTFPHGMGDGTGQFLMNVLGSPFGDRLVLDFGKAAVEAENLGADADPDLLALSLSAYDIAGHSYGPNSREAHDMLLHLDRTLGEFLAFLDQRIGPSNYSIALTSDHGVAPLPALAGPLGGRYDDLTALHRAVDEGLATRFGPGPWVLSLSESDGGGIVLDRQLAAARGHAFAEVAAEAARLARTVVGVRDAAVFAELPGRCLDGNLALRRMAVSYVDGQSPDVVVVYEPFTILWDTNYGTSHGSAWNYDAHVVLIFAGAGVRPGRYSGPVAMTDVAPTLAVLLGIAPPASAVGHPVGAVLALDGS